MKICGNCQKSEKFYVDRIEPWSKSVLFNINSCFLQMSYGAEKVVKASEVVPESDDPICIVIGAIAKGKQHLFLLAGHKVQ